MTASRFGTKHAARPAQSPRHSEGDIGPARILIVDDNREVLQAYQAILLPQPAPNADELASLEGHLFGRQPQDQVELPTFRVDLAASGQEAYEKVEGARREGQPFSVAFVDMRMPGGWDGITTIEALWSLDDDIHVVICTAYSDYSWVEITRRLGTSDRLLILYKPFEPSEILQLACALSAKWLLHRSLRARVNALEARVDDKNQLLQQALSKCDDYEHQLIHRGTHDPLTGLANRVLLTARVDEMITRAERVKSTVLVCFLDFDHFKRVNDGFGHAVGDEVLRLLCDRMLSRARPGDALARLGGDEFVLVIPDCDGPTAQGVIDDLLSYLSEPIQLDGRELALTCSAGCSLFPADGMDADSLLRCAGSALHRAKERGRNCVQFYDDALRAGIQMRVTLETELRRAVKRDQFFLHFQPQVEIATGRVLAVEALLRWDHPKFGRIPPGQFIPIAEETGLIRSITEWTLLHACAQARAWQDLGLSQFRVAVNVSANVLDARILPPMIEQALSETGLDASALELEVTETAAMEDADAVIPLMNTLKELGVTLTIDDFGTGYSNMHYLRRFPIDTLKLDGSFVAEITRDPGSLAIADTIITLAHRLGLSVVGEMAETKGQVVQLARHGCQSVQGYYFSAALPAVECAPIIREGFGPISLPLPCEIGRRTALVFGDEDETIKGAQEQLTADAYQVLMASREDEAFELLALHAVSLVLCAASPFTRARRFLNVVMRMYPDAIRLLLIAECDTPSMEDESGDRFWQEVIRTPWKARELQRILERVSGKESGRTGP